MTETDKDTISNEQSHMSFEYVRNTLKGDIYEEMT